MSYSNNKLEANRNLKSFYRPIYTTQKSHYKYCYRNKILNLTVLLSSSQNHRLWLERPLKSASPTIRFNLDNTLNLNSFLKKNMTVWSFCK